MDAEETPEAIQRGQRLQVFVIGRWKTIGGKRGVTGIAQAAGINRDTLYHWFGGEGEPSLTAVSALAQALRVSRAEIVAAIDGQLPPPDWRQDLEVAMQDFLRSAQAAGVIEWRASRPASQPGGSSRAGRKKRS